MLSLSGTVMNVYKAPQGVNKQGEKYGGDYKVQLQAKNELRNGETRFDLVTLTTKNPEQFQKFDGQVVRVPVGAFVSGNTVQFFMLANAEPIAE